MADKITEQDLAAAVVNWLKENQWEVYQEVQIATYASTADIVAINGPVVWVIECKKTLTLEVIAQAFGWREYAHRLSVAVPSPKRRMFWSRSKGRQYAQRCMNRDGIGCLEVTFHDKQSRFIPRREPSIEERFSGSLYRKPFSLEKMRQGLRDAQKTWAPAGNANGSKWTLFQRTAQELKKYVKKHPGCTMADVMDNIEHHYSKDSTARSCLAGYIHRGIIKGIRTERAGRAFKFFPAEETRDDED